MSRVILFGLRDFAAVLQLLLVPACYRRGALPTDTQGLLGGPLIRAEFHP